ncbi:MAG: hypothetical protein ACTTKL_11535 [Treponema sp.]
MEKIDVFIYRNKSDGRINAIDIIEEKQILKDGVTKEMVLADIEQHNADSRNKSIVEWADCQTLLDAENLLNKIRTLENTAFEEKPKQQITPKASAQ